MRKLILFMHASLDGFVAGTKGEMEWISFDEELFEYASRQTELADTALYGRVTFQLVEGYWPTAGDRPNASKHDIEHSRWYKKVSKVVVSRTMPKNNSSNVEVISDNIPAEIMKLKQRPGKNIVMFGSPGTGHTLMHHNLIDEYWIFVNPILLGNGIPLFKGVQERIKLKLSHTKTFPYGVVGLQYEKLVQPS